MADAADSKSAVPWDVWVRLPPPVPRLVFREFISHIARIMQV